MSGKPSLQVTSVFGECNLEVSDGTNTVCIGLTKKGVQALIDELEYVLSLADDEE